MDPQNDLCPSALLEYYAMVYELMLKAQKLYASKGIPLRHYSHSLKIKTFNQNHLPTSFASKHNHCLISDSETLQLLLFLATKHLFKYIPMRLLDTSIQSQNT